MCLNVLKFYGKVRSFHLPPRCLATPGFEVSLFVPKLFGPANRSRIPCAFEDDADFPQLFWTMLRKSDSDVILALQSLSSDFAKHLHKAGTEGRVQLEEFNHSAASSHTMTHTHTHISQIMRFASLSDNFEAFEIEI